jgi:hypothetical protein
MEMSSFQKGVSRFPPKEFYEIDPWVLFAFADTSSSGELQLLPSLIILSIRKRTIYSNEATPHDFTFLCV